MHVLTEVIVPGPRTTAYGRGGRLAERAIPRSYDYWGIGGIWGGLFASLDLTSVDDRWPDALPVGYLPAPLPDDLIPGALVTPRAGWLRSPPGDSYAPAWIARVNRLIDKYRGGHTLVIFDAHC